MHSQNSVTFSNLLDKSLNFKIKYSSIKTPLAINAGKFRAKINVGSLFFVYSPKYFMFGRSNINSGIFSLTIFKIRNSKVVIFKRVLGTIFSSLVMIRVFMEVSVPSASKFCRFISKPV